MLNIFNYRERKNNKKFPDDDDDDDDVDDDVDDDDEDGDDEDDDVSHNTKLFEALAPKISLQIVSSS